MVSGKYLIIKMREEELKLIKGKILLGKNNKN